MTANLNEILAWADQTAKLVGVTRDAALEWAAAQMQGKAADNPQNIVVPRQARHTQVTKITADIVHPHVKCEIIDGHLSTTERRRIVLAEARAGRTYNVSHIAKSLFDIDRVSSRDRARVIRAVDEDLEYHRKMGYLNDSAAPNGPDNQEDLLMPEH